MKPLSTSTVEDVVPTAELTGQFVLARDARKVPGAWRSWSAAGWTLGTNDLPVRDLVDDAGRCAGWLVGHPVLDGALGEGPVPLGCDDGLRLDWRAVDALLDRLAGRFLLVLLPAEQPTVVLDAYGSLAAVFSRSQQVVASTPTLIEAPPDDDLVEATGFPNRSRWLPFGLTLRRGVRRLQANHALDLRTWTPGRHWLPPEVRHDVPPEDLAMAVYEAARTTVRAVAAVHPLSLSLTAGRDSRLVLACARDVLDRASFFTLVNDGLGAVDVVTARALADRFGLDHTLVPVRQPTAVGLQRSLAVTGHAVGGELWQAHEALEQLDPSRVLLAGTAGEVARGRTWRAGDPVAGPVTPELLLRRMRLPELEVYLAGARTWLAELPELPFSTVLELAYVEQRLSCWAGPGHYGNRTSRFELPPFAGRALFTAALSLPLDYRYGDRLMDDVCRRVWPELLELPFNQHTGLRLLRSQATRVTRRLRQVLPQRAPGSSD